MANQSLYERLGGVYSIAAVTDHFIDALAEHPVIGKSTDNPYLKDWYENREWRAAGFKVLNTLWVCEKAGGPYKYVSTVPADQALDLAPTHYPMGLSAEEFDLAGEVLANSLNHFDVPEREKKEVLDAFTTHKEQVVRPVL